MRACRYALIALALMALAMIPRGALAEEVGALFEHESDVFSKELAYHAINLLSQTDASAMRAALVRSGARDVKLVGLDKDKGDKRHNSAYAAAKTPVTVNGESRTLITICIRGSVKGEWFANFDFMPSRKTDMTYLENFYLAAQDALKSMRPYIDAEQNPIIFVCGVSRGGSCANVLGVLLDDIYGSENVYVYTFSSSYTVKPEHFTGYDNIFNLVNPADVFTAIPAPCWGFARAGVDIVAYASDEATARARAYAEELNAIAPTIKDYYEKRYSVNGANIGSSSLTPYEFMQYFAHMFGGWELNASRARYHLRLLANADTAFDALIEGVMAFDAKGNPTATQLTRQHRLDIYTYLLKTIE